MQFTTIEKIATALRKGGFTSVALAEQAIASHRQTENWNAYKTWTPDNALAAAEAADNNFKRSADHGLLQGIPVSVKDIFGVDNLPTFAGTRHELPAAWRRQGFVVNRVRDSLGVVTGKTHTVEFAFGALGVNSHWGTPVNPWDPVHHRVPGGSSSGASVSIRQGSALVAFGTDTAGSVRIPAAMTGVVGLKTSHGRWPMDGVVPLSQTLDSAGVLVRNVDDAVFAFAAVDARRRTLESLRAEMARRLPETVHVGLPEETFVDCEDGIAEVVMGAVDELQSGGMKMVHLSLPEVDQARALLAQGSVAAAQCAEFVRAELPAWLDAMDPLVSLRIRDGGEISALEYLSRHRQLRKLAAAAAACFAGFTVLACPTVRISPPRVDDAATAEAYRPRNMAALANTCFANMMRLCAVTIPAGLDRNGMPVGLQLLAPHNEEELLLAVAARAEEILGAPDARIGKPSPPPEVRT